MAVIEGLTTAFGGTTGNNTTMSASAVCAFKLRFRGDCITEVPGSGFTPLVLVSDGSGNINAYAKVRDQGSGNCRLEMTNNILGINADCPDVAKTAFSASTYYCLYAHVQNANPYVYIQVTDDSGTVIGSQSASVTINPGTTTTGHGTSYIGNDVGEGTGPTGAYDGLAIYTAVLAGAAQYSTPATGDANLAALYWCNDTSGTTLTAAVGQNFALSGGVGTAYQWTAGEGLWDPASQALSETLAAVDNTATLSDALSQSIGYPGSVLTIPVA